jgi:hypothetical protein
MATPFQQLDDVEFVVVVPNVGLVQGAVIVLVYLGRGEMGQAGWGWDWRLVAP